MAMNYLHLSHPIIIHRDLKPANILIDRSGSFKGALKRASNAGGGKGGGWQRKNVWCLCDFKRQ